MLLLVLIFVLAAFGLLLVALVTGTAAWAWISVVVSVAAAAVLVYDWAQRRAAVKNGGEPASRRSDATEMIDPPTTMIPALGAMAEPATEVFQAMRIPSPASDPQGSPPDRSAGQPLVGAPPGSAEQPPSAEPDGPRTTDDRSQSVTSGGSSRPTERDSVDPAQSGEARDEAVANDSAKAGDQPPSSPWRPGESKPGRPGVPPPGQPANWPARPPEVAASAGHPADADSPQPVQTHADRADAGSRADAQSDVAARSAGESAAVEGTPGPAPVSRPPADAPVEDEPSAAVPEPGAVDEPVLVQDVATQDGGSGTADVSATDPGTRVAAEREATAPPTRPAAPPGSGPERTTVLPAHTRTDQPAKQTSMGGAEATQAITPAREPGEERPEPAAAAIVATLEDQVLVIDEEPRFHLTGCPLLAGRETIPLAVREAVEYEFTPCAVCQPVRVLAARNRAASSS